jgi:hypothetical protein
VNKPQRRLERPRAGTFLIADTERFQSLVRRAIDNDYRGNLSEAVRVTNGRVKFLNTSRRLAGAEGQEELSQPELWKLTAGKIRSIKESTFLWLLALLPRKAHPELEAVVLSSIAAFRLREFEEFAARHSNIVNPTFVQERNRLIVRWRRRFPSEFSPFDHLVNARRHSPEAVELAYDRMAGPFVAGFEGGHIEREWTELKGEEQRRYLRAAIKRELLLLDRPNDLARAQSDNPAAGLTYALWSNSRAGSPPVSYLFR